MRGKIYSADRLQRILIGAVLVSLNLYGMTESLHWTKWVALALQVEILMTGLAGWCPVYWACNVGAGGQST